LIVCGLLLSNLRATWISAGWKPESGEAALPPRFSDSWSDKLVDQMPSWLRTKIRIIYYIFSACLLALVAFGLSVLVLRRNR
jgi:hypothetical protein